MKKRKYLSILIILTLICSMFSGILTAKAAASATVEFGGNSTVSVGNNITITMYISNVTDTTGGIVSVGGNLSFDSEYLEYVSATGETSPYTFQINPTANYIIAGLDTTLSNGIIGSSQTKVFTFVFKAKKEGSTQITLTNAKLSDISNKITSVVNSKTVTITGNKSSDATLKSLSASGYTLSPSFSSNTTSYTLKVPSDATTVKLEGAANDSKAIVNGLGNITLTGDKTTATIKVTAEDGTVKTYTVAIEKETSVEVSKSSDATLKSLSASGYALSPSFSSNTISYTLKVPSDATTVKLEGAANDSKAIVNGLGNITLTGDKTTATIKVTAEDGTVKTYTVAIEKETSVEVSKSSDATLKTLDVSGFTLNPTFKSNINTYSMKVKNNITALKVTAIPNHDKATIAITGNSNWKEGVNVVTIKVTAEDGTINNYIVNVTREPKSTTTVEKEPQKSSDNYLKNLIINSSHDIDKAFNKTLSSYNLNVPYEVEKLDLSYVTSDSKAKVVITGNEKFKVGEVNTVEIEVTAEDGTKRFYTLNVTRSTQDADADLKDLVIKEATLSPSFNPDILEYTAKVDGDTDKLNIMANPTNDGSKVEIIGNDNLKEGNNTILVKVTDKKGFTKYYTINVEKGKKENKILGLTPIQFGIYSGIVGLLLLFLLLLLLLLRRRKNDKVEENKPVTPIIEVKPEFNFGSKNSSDDDIVHGNLNQNSDLSEREYGKQDILNHRQIEGVYEENIPYDPYDDIVTKDEIVDAIEEAVKTKDPAKLKMLLEQEALNRKKEELRKRSLEEKEETDDWRL